MVINTFLNFLLTFIIGNKYFGALPLQIFRCSAPYFILLNFVSTNTCLPAGMLSGSST
jgi:hypothetical protein